jgi:MFS family permease
MNWRALLANHGRIIGFGFVLALISSFGQTTFISLSVPDIREAFGLSHGGFGSIYSAATLVSGLSMIWVGSIIDRVSVRRYAGIALLGLCLAALGLSLAQNLIALGVALFALRICGQGMLSHAAVTSTARLPDGTRGRAVGIATLGFPTGEAFLPGTGLALITAFGWATMWQLAAALLALCLVLGFVATPRSKAVDQVPPAPDHPADPDPGAPRRRDILRDPRFVIFIPSLVAPSAVLTAFVFHQRFVAATEGWSLELLAGSITTYAIASLLLTFVSGALVDRFGGLVLARFHLLGIAAAGVALTVLDGPLAAPIVFGFLGMTSGANNTVIPAVLAELYGTRHLGRIRALAGALSVVASATTPGAVGALFDAGVTPSALLMGFGIYVSTVSLLNAVALRR